MRIKRLIVILIPGVLSFGACQKGSELPASPGTNISGTSTLHGTLQEKIDSGGYSYVRLATPSGERWAAIPVTPLEAGAEIDLDVQMTHATFESKTLKRTFTNLIFATIVSGAVTPVGKVENQHALMSNQKTMVPNPHTAVGTPAATIVSQQIVVSRVLDADGRTVAEVYAQKGTLKNARIAVRGKVVKYNAGIMGKNWLHLRDGSGNEGTNDLTVTTTAAAALGDVVAVRGVLRLEKDFGSGYKYDVIVEDALVTHE